MVRRDSRRGARRSGRRGVPGERPESTRTELSRKTRQRTLQRSTAERSADVRLNHRTRLAHRSSAEFRRIGRTTVRTHARHQRREPKKGRK